MTLVPNETEQALNRQHDVYAAAREEYRKKIAEQAAEIERLRAALERIASLDVPRPVGHTFRADGVASKHDKCWHGVTMSDECGVCLSNYARAALEGKDD